MTIAGCGDGGSDGPSRELIEFAPADAIFFAEATVRPEGDLKEDIESILDRFPDGDELGDTIIREIDKGIEEEAGDATYEDDIEPWLGERAAVFFTDLAPESD